MERVDLTQQRLEEIKAKYPGVQGVDQLAPDDLAKLQALLTQQGREFIMGKHHPTAAEILALNTAGRLTNLIKIVKVAENSSTVGFFAIASALDDPRVSSEEYLKVMKLGRSVLQPLDNQLRLIPAIQLLVTQKKLPIEKLIEVTKTPALQNLLDPKIGQLLVPELMDVKYVKADSQSIMTVDQALALTDPQRARLVKDDVFIKLCEDKDLNKAMIKTTDEWQHVNTLIRKFDHYIERINLHKDPKDATKPDFRFRFWVMKDSRAANREANYKFSNTVRTELLKIQTGLEENSITLEAATEAIAALFTDEKIAENRPKVDSKYKDRGINSSELKGIIKEAREYAKVDEPKAVSSRPPK